MTGIYERCVSVLVLPPQSCKILDTQDTAQSDTVPKVCLSLTDREIDRAIPGPGMKFVFSRTDDQNPRLSQTILTSFKPSVSVCLSPDSGPSNINLALLDGTDDCSISHTALWTPC